MIAQCSRALPPLDAGLRRHDRVFRRLTPAICMVMAPQDFNDHRRDIHANAGRA